MGLQAFFSSRRDGMGVARYAVTWLLLVMMAVPASAQVSAQAEGGLLDVRDEWARVIDKARAVAPVGADLFGDSTSYYSGETTFAVTDVSLPGNSRLPVAVARTHSTAQPQGPTAPGLFGEWELDVPNLHGVFARGSGWQVSGPNPNARCSATLQVQPPSASNGPGTFAGFDYWSGNSMYIPGAGDQQMLVPASNNTQYPRDGKAYPWTTNGRWWLSCLATTANGMPGEAFVARSPDGTTYRFDWVVVRPYSTLSRPASGGAVHLLKRDEVRIYPTRIQDRHGNWVNYTWSGAQLQRIDANDGRSLVLTYNTGGRIASVSAGARVWRYTYASSGRAGLVRVDLPDGSVWTLNTAVNTITYLSRLSTQCDDPGILNTPVNTYTFTHPSGATGVFQFKPVRHGRSKVTPRCRTDKETGAPEYGAPKIFDTFALIGKTISGPGVSPQTWTVAYGPANDSYAGCTTCATTKTVEVTGPGDYVRYTFGNEFYRTEGKLLRTERGIGPGVILSVEDSNYLFDQAASAYQPFVGYTGRDYEDAVSAQWIFPLKSQVISQQGVIFTRTVNSFDAYANPVSVTRSSTLDSSATESTVYHYDTAQWVLGQVASVTDVGTGKKISETTYDTRALPITSRSFGRLTQTLTYNADGTLATVKDGNNRSTTLSSWYRGIPRRITFPDASKISAAVDGNGWITQVTDQLLNATGYAYDPMGRVKTVTPPIGDAVAWSPTSIDFVPVASTEYGLAAGHWRRTESRGNYRKQTFYDAYWRPVIEREYDNANATASQRFRGWQYDHDGKVVFDGYPLASATGITSFTAGTRTSYDALGRPMTVRQDSELGVLTTTYAYLTGFQTRVTNPRGFATTTSFQAFDTPDTSNPVVIQSPEGATTTIARDVFGKPLSVTRSGSYAGSALSVARRYVYDGNERLCKRIEPESGATLFDYDGANNLVWSAEGTALTGTSCDRASVVSTAKVLRSYDAMNRVTLVDYPGTTADISSSYDADGALRTHSSGGSVWTYGYNKLRLPTSETLVVDGKSFAFSTGYNPLAQPVSQGYPVGAAVASTVNALGQTTAITGYASGISYYPNGAIKGFTYGNGIVRTLTQNTRGLPVRAYEVKGSTAILDDTYTYDPNGNVDYITDGLPGNLTTRDLGYDGLDRLLVADALNQWGKATYAYDPLDNLRVADQGTRQYRYNYNISTQRLDSIKTPTGGLLHSFQYNAQGDTTAKNSALYSFDAAHRLLSVANVASYSYDGHGRRIKETPQGGAVQYQVYSRAGQRLITDNSGSGNRFVYLGNTLLAAETYTGTTLGAGNFLHTDALGSVVVRTDKTTGTVTKRNAYAPYGEPYNSTIGGLGYTGHEMDLDTGLVYMQQRYYDPQIGRFLSADPVAARPSGNNFNRYAYANNNPYKFTDPDGRMSSWVEALTNTFAGTNTKSEDSAFRGVSEQVVSTGEGAVASSVNAVGNAADTVSSAVADRVSVNAKGTISAGTGLQATKNLANGSDSVGVVAVGQGSYVGVTTDVKVLSLDFSNGESAPVSFEVSGDVGAVGSIGGSISFNPAGKIDATISVGLGIGEHTSYAPTVNVEIDDRK